MANQVVTELTDDLILQVAALMAVGTTQEKTAEQLKINRNAVRRCMRSELYKKTREEIAQESVQNAVQLLKSNADQMAREAHRVIMSKLADDDLEAAKLVLKIVGIDKQEEVKADTNIQVVLPGAEGGAIEVKSEVVEDESN